MKPIKATPPFYIQLTDAEGRVVRTRCGGTHERDLTDLFVKTILAKGVGFWHTQAHVEQDIRDGIAEAIASLKVQNPIDTI